VRIGARCWVLGLLLTACYPAGSPDPEHLPPCFVQGAPRVSAGKSLVRVRWVHDTDGAFDVRRVEVSLDDRPIHASRDETALERELAHLVDFEVEPGTHQLRTLVHVTGNGYGVFAYLNDYKTDLVQTRALTTTAGSASCVSLVVSYGDSPTIPVEERPRSILIEEQRPVKP
jgi:hypothetical protein